MMGLASTASAILAAQWGAINAYVAIVAGILIPLISALATGVWWFHRRVKQLEQESEDREQAVFGQDENPLNIGLVKEVQEIKRQVEDLETTQKEQQERQNEIVARLGSIEQRLTDNGFHKKEDEDGQD